MAIIVEDGSNIPGSNSYVSLADARAILIPFGQELDSVDEIAEQQILLAANYIDAFRQRYQGWKTLSTQSMQWPRVMVSIDGFSIAFDVIPQDLINAQVFAAYEVSLGQILQPTSTNQSIKSEEVEGAVRVSYFDTGAVDGSPVLVRVNDSLNPLFTFSDPSIRGIRG